MGEKQQGTERKSDFLQNFLGAVELSRVAWGWWNFCDLILGQTQGVDGILFLSLGPGLGVKSGSGSGSFLGPFTLCGSERMVLSLDYFLGIGAWRSLGQT